jgi:hypothetical protein
VFNPCNKLSNILFFIVAIIPQRIRENDTTTYKYDFAYSKGVGLSATTSMAIQVFQYNPDLDQNNKRTAAAHSQEKIWEHF